MIPAMVASAAILLSDIDASGWLVREVDCYAT
jgi:hypothetical protein